MEPWRVIAGTVLLVALIGGLGWVLVSDGDERSTPVTTLRTMTQPDVSTTPTPVSTTRTVAAPLPPTVTSMAGADVDTSATLRDTEDALAAWGRFAVTGDVNQLVPTFVAEGPQWSQLVIEAPKLAEQPLGEPAYAFTLVEPRIDIVSADEHHVRAEVVMSRPGEPAQQFTWAIHMRWGEDRWRLWTVVAE